MIIMKNLISQLEKLNDKQRAEVYKAYAKEYLSQLDWARKNVASLERQVDYFEAKAEGYSSANYATGWTGNYYQSGIGKVKEMASIGIPSQRNLRMPEDIFICLADKRKEYQTAVINLLELERKIDNEVTSADLDVCGLAILYRYINQWSVDAIAEKLNRCARQVRNYLNRGLELYGEILISRLRISA